MASENILFVQPGDQNQSLTELRQTLQVLDPSLHTPQGLNEILSLEPGQLQRRLNILLNSPNNNQQGQRPLEPFVFSFQNYEGRRFPGPARFYDDGIANIEAHRFVLPVPPSDINVSVPNSPQTVTTISGLQYSHAGDIELEEISFEGFFPHIGPDGGNKLPSYVPHYIHTYGYRRPQRLVSEFTTAMRANQPVLFSIFANDSTGVASSAGVTVIEPIAMSISSFEWQMGNATGGTRRDITYSMTLKRWRSQTIKVTTFKRG